jgi:signal transduction histidine kinase
VRLRLRLTLLYGGLFLAAGAVLLGLNYALVRQGLERRSVGVAVPAPSPAGSIEPALPFDVLVTPDGRVVAGVLERLENEVRAQALHELLTKSLLALAVMGVVSVGLGWAIAGRALRPLHDITATARRLSEHDLHERLALEGPPDELKELADTFDGMLARLEAAFASQKRFVANASHELRTPLAIQRTLIDVALADPKASRDDLRTMAVEVRDAVDRSERLIEGLLVLAQSERGELPRREPVDLALAARRALDQQGPEIERLGLDVEAAVGPAPAVGSPVLVERMVANVIENGVRHNQSGGWLRVATFTDGDGGCSVLRVANTGPVVPASEVGGLFEPFRRLDADRLNSARGAGLGLSIVRAVAAAHGGSVRAEARPDGGLEVVIELHAA